jgi:hypothetical protein
MANILKAVLKPTRITSPIALKLIESPLNTSAAKNVTTMLKTVASPRLLLLRTRLALQISIPQ